MNNKYRISEDITSLDEVESCVHVTDENNNIVVREIDNGKVYYTLLTENKMELIGLKKEEINKEINAAMERLSMLKRTIPIYPIVIGVVGGFLILVKIIKPEALVTNSWQGLVAAVGAGEIGVGTVAIVENIYNKKEIKVLKEKLKALEKYENEPIGLDKPDYLEHDFTEENIAIENDINNIIESIDSKSKKRKKTK